jgi:hypothetical protein
MFPLMPLYAALFRSVPFWELHPGPLHTLHLKNQTMKTAITDKSFVIKPTTHKQLAAYLGVSPHVLHTWLKPLPSQLFKKGNTPYSLEQVLLIYKTVGLPFPLSPETKLLEEALSNL